MGTLYTVTAHPGGITATGANSPIIVKGLTPDQPYTFTVHATNEAGSSGESTPSEVAIPSGVPSKPLNVVATRGNTSATVSFSPPASGGDMLYYTVTKSGGGTTQGSGSPIFISGLTNGVSYTFTVTATNEVGESPASDPSNAIVPATIPNVPTIASAVPANGQITLSWNTPSNGGDAIIDYTATAEPGGWSITQAASPAVFTGLTNGQLYTLKVRARNSVGSSADSSTTTATPVTVPSAPLGVSAANGNFQATISFSAPASNGGSPITSYTVTSNPGGFTGTGAASPIIVSGLAGVSYTFTVTATNAVGTGPASSPSNAVTPTQNALPNAPASASLVMANPGNAQLTITAPTIGAPFIYYTITNQTTGQKYGGGPNERVVYCSGKAAGSPAGTVFAIRGVNQYGEGSPLNNTSITLPANSATPDTLETPYLPVISAIGGGKIRVTWSLPPGFYLGSGASSISSWMIWILSSSYTWQYITYTPPGGSPFSYDYQLSNGVVCRVSIMANNNLGVLGGSCMPSNVVTVVA